MLDAHGIIHMNGRIYDPRLGRFLQADPIVQFPHYSQSWNTYSYVLNNPLTYTDPSGYFIGKLFNKVFKGLNKALGDFAPFLGIALLAIPVVRAWVISSWGSAFSFGFWTGGIASGSYKGALFGGISAAAFYGIGSQFAAEAGFFQQEGLGHVLTHGLAGGILAELQGGQFGYGFLAAGLSKAVMGRFSYADGSAPAVMGRTTIAAVVGGTISRITGGKFANGALTSAMAQLFNNETSARNMKNRAGTCSGEICIGYGERRILRRTSSEPRIRWKGTDTVNWLEAAIDPILGFILKRPIPTTSIRMGIESGHNEYEHQVGYQEYQYVTEGLGVIRYW